MMGTNGGNIGGAPGGNELGGMMAGNANHPPATEYTLQGKQPSSGGSLPPHDDPSSAC